MGRRRRRRRRCGAADRAAEAKFLLTRSYAIKCRGWDTAERRGWDIHDVLIVGRNLKKSLNISDSFVHVHVHMCTDYSCMYIILFMYSCTCTSRNSYMYVLLCIISSPPIFPFCFGVECSSSGERVGGYGRPSSASRWWRVGGYVKNASLRIPPTLPGKKVQPSGFLLAAFLDFTIPG